MARKSEYPAWEKFSRALTTYRKHQQEYSKAKPGSRAKSKLQAALRDDGLRLQTYFNEQTRYNTTSNPSAILNPKTGKAAGQWHHAATQKRLLPFLLTVKTRQDYVKLTDAFKQYGIGIGNAYQNMFDLPGELHASNDPRAIHRVEEIAGLDAPDRYLKPGATVDDAIKAIPYLAEDVTGSKGFARRRQMQGSIVGENSRFSDQVMQTSTKELSQATHDKRARNRQTAQLAIEKRNKGLPTAKTITNESYNIVHGEQLADKVTPRPQVTELGKGLGGIFSKVNIGGNLRRTDNLAQLGIAASQGDTLGTAISGTQLAAGEALQTRAVQSRLAKQIAKLAAKRAASTTAKLVPGLDLAISGAEAYDYAKRGKWLSAGRSALSGAVGWVPVVGDAASASLDLWNTAEDISDLHTQAQKQIDYFKNVDP